MVKDIITNDNQQEGLKSLWISLELNTKNQSLHNHIYLLEHHVSNDKGFFGAFSNA
jgi:hypothetical protein